MSKSMETKKFNGLTEVLNYLKEGKLKEGDTLKNLNTGEEVVYHKGTLHYLTSGDFVSNKVTLTSEALEAGWELELNKLVNIELEGAVRHVIDGGSVYYKETVINDLGELLEAIKDLFYLEPFTEMEDLTLKVKESQVKDQSKHARKTTETEAWAILMDRYLFEFTAKELANKYGLSLRNIYYIIDGTYYESTYDKFEEVFGNIVEERLSNDNN